MSVSPDEAYKAARAAREKRLQAEETARAEAEAFPGLAERKLSRLADYILAHRPQGLDVATDITPGGGLDPDLGVKGLFIKVFEDGKVVAQGSIRVTSERKVHMDGFPPDRDPRPDVEFRVISYDELDEDAAVALLSDIISAFIV